MWIFLARIFGNILLGVPGHLKMITMKESFIFWLNTHVQSKNQRRRIIFAWSALTGGSFTHDDFKRCGFF